YLVERSTDGGVNFAPLAIVAANATSHSDTTASEATSYVYRVKPINATGTGVGVTVSALTVPAAPSLLTATAITVTRVDLSWTDNSSGENGFTIERSTDGGTTWSTLTTRSANVTTYS